MRETHRGQAFGDDLGMEQAVSIALALTFTVISTSTLLGTVKFLVHVQIPLNGHGSDSDALGNGDKRE